MQARPATPIMPLCKSMVAEKRALETFKNYLVIQVRTVQTSNLPILPRSVAERSRYLLTFDGSYSCVIHPCISIQFANSVG